MIYTEDSIKIEITISYKHPSVLVELAAVHCVSMFGSSEARRTAMLSHAVKYNRESLNCRNTMESLSCRILWNTTCCKILSVWAAAGKKGSNLGRRASQRGEDTFLRGSWCFERPRVEKYTLKIHIYTNTWTHKYRGHISEKKLMPSTALSREISRRQCDKNVVVIQ